MGRKLRLDAGVAAGIYRLAVETAERIALLVDDGEEVATVLFGEAVAVRRVLAAPLIEKASSR